MKSVFWFLCHLEKKGKKRVKSVVQVCDCSTFRLGSDLLGKITGFLSREAFYRIHGGAFGFF